MSYIITVRNNNFTPPSVVAEFVVQREDVEYKFYNKFFEKEMQNIGVGFNYRMRLPSDKAPLGDKMRFIDHFVNEFQALAKRRYSYSRSETASNADSAALGILRSMR